MSIALYAPLIRGLKQLNPYNVESGFRGYSTLCPAHQGIETWSLCVGAVRRSVNIALYAPLIRGLKPL